MTIYDPRLQIRTLEAANRFLRGDYIAEFNRRFQVAPAQRGNAFVPCRSRDLERIFSLQFQRSVNRDNTVSFQNLSLQIERVRWRATLAGCQVVVHQHLNGTLSLTHGPHCLGRYDAVGQPLPGKASTEMSRGRETDPFPSGAAATPAAVVPAKCGSRARCAPAPAASRPGSSGCPTRAAPVPPGSTVGGPPVAARLRRLPEVTGPIAVQGAEHAVLFDHLASSPPSPCAVDSSSTSCA